MLVTNIVGNIKNYSVPIQKAVETIEVENESLAKRIHHLKSNTGREVSVRLAPGKHLHVGDILLETATTLVIVEVVPEDVLVISPDTLQEMGSIAHELGNRHLPAQFTEHTMIVQYDHLVEQLLEHKSVAFERKKVKVSEPFRHIGHSHDD